MNKLFVMGDLHLTDSLMEEYRHLLMRDMPRVAQQHGVDGIVILGDLTEQKDRHPAKLVNRVVDHIVALSRVAPVAVLMGNHDYKNEGYAFFQFLHKLRDVVWIGSATHGQELGSRYAVFKDCLFLPHTRNYKRDWKVFKENRVFESSSVVFAHNTFNGASVGFGRQLEGIPVEYFPRKTCVVAGDIHVPQELGPVTYVGAPYTVDFGDDYQSRVLIIDGKKMESISTAEYPQKKLVEIDKLDDLKLRRVTSTLHVGDTLRIRVNVDNLEAWSDLHKQVIAFCTKRGWVPQRIEPVMRKGATKKRVKVVQSQNADDGELIEQFGKRHSVDDRVLDMGLKIMERSNEES